LRALKPADYQKLLRVFISRMPRLFLGTLDSFFSAILRSFPAEFGLTGDFEILSEHLGGMERERVCRRCFSARFPASKPARKASRPSRSFWRRFAAPPSAGRSPASAPCWISSSKISTKSCCMPPMANCGAIRSAVWPKGCHWLEAKVDLKTKRRGTFAAFGGADTHDKAWEFWEEFRDQLGSITNPAS
jgi:hypothetical protein